VKLFSIFVSVGLVAIAAGGCDSESSDDAASEAGAAGTGGAAGKGGSAGKGNAGNAGRSGAAGSGDAAGAGAGGSAGEGGAGGSPECLEIRGYPVDEEDWCIETSQPRETFGCAPNGCPDIMTCARRPSDGKHFATNGCLPDGWESCEREDEILEGSCATGGAGGDGGD
jgi:hypothetical protein